MKEIEKSGTDSPFRAGQLRILNRLRGAKKVSVPDFPIFSQLLSSTLSIFELHRIGPWLRVMNRAVGDFNAIGNEEKRRVQ